MRKKKSFMKFLYKNTVEKKSQLFFLFKKKEDICRIDNRNSLKNDKGCI